MDIQCEINSLKMKCIDFNKIFNVSEDNEGS